MPSPLEIVAFRTRNDDGDETTATWRGAQDEQVWVPLDTTFRLRIEVEETTGASESAVDYGLQFRRNGGEWFDVDSAEVVVPSASPNLADSTATTDQLTAGSGTFSAGQFDEVDGDVSNTVGALGHVEHEFSVELLSSEGVAQGDLFEFRLARASDGAVVGGTVPSLFAGVEPLRPLVPAGMFDPQLVAKAWF